MDLADFEQRIGYRFKDKNLLSTALTHSSYANERKASQVPDNERLEFLGDAVLETVVSDYLFRHFPDMPEGELTRFRAGVVCEPVLVKVANELCAGDFLLLGKGEETTGGRERKSILADAFEAVAGAIYLDGGMRRAKSFILKNLTPEIKRMRESFLTIDNKTRLQEIIQRTSRQPVVYVIVGETGPDHDKTFTAEASHSGETLGRGVGRSKKEAEQNAAHESLGRYA